MSRKRIVILGGGTGGTLIANRLRRRFDADEAEIHVVDRDGRHVYQPGLLFVPFGLTGIEEIVRPRRRQLRNGIVFHEAEIDSGSVECVVGRVRSGAPGLRRDDAVPGSLRARHRQASDEGGGSDLGPQPDTRSGRASSAKPTRRTARMCVTPTTLSSHSPITRWHKPTTPSDSRLLACASVLNARVQEASRRGRTKVARPCKRRRGAATNETRDAAPLRGNPHGSTPSSRSW